MFSDFSTLEPSGPQRGRMTLAKSNSHESKTPEFEPFKGAQPRAPTTQALSVLGVDMYMTDNKKAHNTSKYKNSNLIVRRNQEFIMIINFNRPLNDQQDNVHLEFMIGDAPDEYKDTYIIVSIGKENRDGNWSGRVIGMQGNEVMVGITTDASCIIGRFRTFVAVITDFGRQRTPRNPDTDFYVLFNPWDPKDVVYMAKDTDRQEYVMNDVGIIYNGDFNNITSRAWNFGQFEKGVLDACLLVLDAGKVPLLYRGNAIEVVRQGSALINSQDDDGVLVGNWSGDYSTGTAPTAWTGSPEILLKYARDGCVPVCFAQCWVFAGVLNTFVRCLGIPGRVISNYCSAHDNTGNLKTDIILDEDGRVNRSRTKDSVWNYHSWNEVYMKRPDLPEKFSGWQVIDCTPQETSDGLYRCGPTSVNAIKEGELSYPFDARFVFAELNSDVVYHQSDKYGNTKIVFVDTTYVGKLLITKRVNSNAYEDITSAYKHPEGSDKDKQAMQMAENRGVPSRNYTKPPEAGVDIELQAGTIKIGDNFKLTLNIKNQTSQTCTLSAIITGCVVYYTGITSSIFKLDNKAATVGPWKTSSVVIDVTASEYMPYRVEQSNLLFVVYGSIEETDKTLSTMRIVSLLPPDLTIKVTGTPRFGRDFMVTVSFQNPFDFILKNIQLRLESPGLITTKMKTYDHIAPGGSLQYTEMITPQHPGKKMLIACLDCPTVRQVTSQLEIFVQ
ncbi:coagulation factor XIII A chain-like [Carassius auratus]|uniref:protein-glutamine gamma-glutamyltransferase n=1 Tax=Carassius auratus TaxID=7957 RepID=A0A6P6MBV7_CARAU|nr:coagulation factor XIII A chain-like [Carassius auratus]XP_026093432.1 coagulation factor XIII A chain-like [Carassius auratus]